MDPRIEDAVRDGGVGELDARGLMPLAEARAIVRAVSAFAKGEGSLIGGRHVLASDVIWAALLSLADGDELVAAASRLDWEFSPRCFDNVDLYLRYGEAIVPWLATRLDGDGVLHDVPWCVVPCLLACGGPAAFDLMWRVRRVEGRTIALHRAWLDRHPAAGAVELAARAAGDPRARAHLAGLRLRGHGVASGPARAASADDILALLDACALQLTAGPALGWPRPDGTPLHAIAARDGSDWGLSLERIEGDRPSGVRARRVVAFAIGSRVPGLVRQHTRPAPSIDEPAAALPALGLSARAQIVAVVPHLAHVAAPTLPSSAAVYQALARALQPTSSPS